MENETQTPESAPTPTPSGGPPPIDKETRQANTFAMLCHLSGLAIFLGIPFGNLIGPLVFWLIKKDESDFVEDQAREALNFQITVLIALFAAGLSIFAVIGCVLTPGVVVANIVFCILAAMTANDGRTYRYPLTLRLIK